MAASTLFRMDDFLLQGAARMGVVVVLLAGLGAAVMAQDGGDVSGRLLAGFVLFAAAPIAMAWVGLQIRHREKRALSLWRLIDREVEISASDLLRDSDWTAEQLERAIRDLNNAAVAYVVWDRSANLVQDGRLRRSSIVVDECTACSGKISLQIRIGSTSAPRCPYCDEPIDIALIAEQKARLIDELESDGCTQAPGTTAVPGAGEFSIVFFVLLLAAFWPAALWYCARHRNNLAALIR